MDLITTIGRFHPVLVHLPIGIFVTVLLLSVFSMTEKYSFIGKSVRIILAAGLITALLSLISGYVLSLEGANAEEDVDIHKWTAIGMTLVYTGYYFFSPLLTQYKIPNLIALFVLLISLLLTGHQGGSLTHGENYLLSAGKPNSEKTIVPVITDINNADIYHDIVGYTLQTKCVECHGENKQKGRLRLDDPTWIEKGGKNGSVITKGDPDKSELIKRFLLDENDDHHMPPKEKTQLTTAEKSILTWWVSTGAKYNASIASLKPDEKIIKDLEDFKSKLSIPQSIQIERKAVPPANNQQIIALKKLGWVIAPIAANDNHLRATGFNLTITIDTALIQLGGIAEQLVELKINNAGINDSSIKQIEKFQNLEKLWLDNNRISDIGIQSIKKLSKLQYLNLSNNNITVNGLSNMKGLDQLRSLYLTRTNIKAEDVKKIMGQHSNLKIYTTDSLYHVPTDSLLVKKEK